VTKFQEEEIEAAFLSSCNIFCNIKQGQKMHDIHGVNVNLAGGGGGRGCYQFKNKNKTGHARKYN
jgi:hypothetical protein